MKTICKLLLISSAFFCYQCKIEKPIKKSSDIDSIVKDSSIFKKNLQEALKTPWDSLNKENVTPFFTEFGLDLTVN